MTLPRLWGHRELGRRNSRGLGQPQPSRTTVAIPHALPIPGTGKSRCQLVLTQSLAGLVVRWHRPPIGASQLFPCPRVWDIDLLSARQLLPWNTGTHVPHTHDLAQLARANMNRLVGGGNNEKSTPNRFGSRHKRLPRLKPAAHLTQEARVEGSRTAYSSSVEGYGRYLWRGTPPLLDVLTSSFESSD